MTIQAPAAPPPPTSTDELPTTTTASTAAPKSKKLTLLPLIFLIYLEVAGGPYGEEPAVQAAGPLLAILGFIIFPFIWSIPEALITAELSTAFPGNGGFVIWADRAFGPLFGSLMGTWKFLSGVINIAAFPALCIDYLKRLFPIFESGKPRTIAILLSTAVLTFLNYTGLAIVGYVAVGLGVISLAPFLLMSLIAVPQIHPHRWISLGQKGVKKDWNLFFNTLFWNLNFWDNVSTMAGEVENPRKTFPLAPTLRGDLHLLRVSIPLNRRHRRRTSGSESLGDGSGHGGDGVPAGVLRGVIEVVRDAVGGDSGVDRDSGGGVVHELHGHSVVGEFPVQLGDVIRVKRMNLRR